MDITSAITSLGNDYVSKVSSAMEKSALLNTEATKISSDESFDTIFSAVSGMLSSTNDYIQKAQQAEVDFALGNMTNSHELGVYQQQANMALQFTVAVRDKALEAYKEIMNMQF